MYHREFNNVAKHIVLAFLVATIGFLPAAHAEPRVTADLLLPYFQVDLDGGERTTLFSFGNVSSETVRTVVEIRSNWGIGILEVPVVLSPRKVVTINLQDWLKHGRLPAETLAFDELAHLQDALSGRASLKTQLYYGSEIEADLAVGSVIVRAQEDRPQVLWGDYFLVDPRQDFAQGEVLVDIDPRHSCRGICERHALRFLDGGAFDGGTRLVVWTAKQGAPSEFPSPAEPPLRAEVGAFAEDGTPLDLDLLDLLAASEMQVSELAPQLPFGWLDLSTSEDAYVAVRYSANNRFSVGLQSWCLRPHAE